jgi:glycosyltransferase involved in cell wall biosynthesis
VASSSPSSGLVFVGATRATYQEIDSGLASTLRDRAAIDGLADRVLFVESTLAIDKYFRAADLFVLPSIREGLSIALLEAMSTGLACVATRLPGSTDTMIHDGVNGILVAPDDRDGFTAAIRLLLDDSERAARIGSAARQTVLNQYSIYKTAAAWLAVYHEAAEAR